MALVDNDVIDLNLSEIRKKKLRIDGDANRIIELNLSDMNIIGRLDEAYPKLDELASKVSTLLADENDSDIADKLKEIDKDMRDWIDFIFDGKVADVCVPDGTMYDLSNGKFKFEYIVEKLATLYTENIQNEIKQMKARVSKHTRKYTKKK